MHNIRLDQGLCDPVLLQAHEPVKYAIGADALALDVKYRVALLLLPRPVVRELQLRVQLPRHECVWRGQPHNVLKVARVNDVDVQDLGAADVPDARVGGVGADLLEDVQLEG